MHHHLIQRIKHLVNLTDEEIELVKTYVKPFTIKKGDYMVKDGQVCEHLAFINQGFFRIYILDNDMNEITIHLAGKHDFISAMAGFISHTTTQENIQALCDTEVLRISYTDLQYLYGLHPRFERLGRLVLENHFIRKENRVISFITEPAEKRYKSLMEENPDFILNIPLQYIASYLGVKPETLSRIRAKFTS